jgi:hypothetical protein
MKTKETLDPKLIELEKVPTPKKPKSLRPLRSMVAVRSLRPRTNVASMQLKTDVLEKN